MSQRHKPSRQPWTVVDLFSGAGGISAGFSAHPSFQIVGAADAQLGKPSSRAGSLACNATYEANIGLRPEFVDLSTIAPEELRRRFQIGQKRVDVLLACPPCTGFSRTLSANHLRDDPRNSLVRRVSSFVREFRPRVVWMENARELAMGRFSHHLEVLTEDLAQQGYDVNCQVHSLSDFGLPQSRERALIVATEKGLTPRTLVDLWDGWGTRTGVTNVRHAIAHLPPIGAGERHPEDGMHVSPAFGSPRTLQRLSQIPHDGGSWMDLVRSNRTDLLTPSMHRSVQRGTLGSHPDVYGRLWWDRPSVTIKRECAHVGNGRYSHPEQDRMLSLREVALLNGFPTDYMFSGAGLANQYRHVGDAVPPLISYQMAWATSWTFTGQRPEPASFVLPGTSLTAKDIVSSHELVA